MAHSYFSSAIHRYESLLKLLVVSHWLTKAVGMCLLDTVLVIFCVLSMPFSSYFRGRNSVWATETGLLALKSVFKEKMLTPKPFSDGALMMALYTATAYAKDQIAIAYYSIVLTVITVAVAMVIGFVQMLTLVRNVGAPARFFLIQLQS